MLLEMFLSLTSSASLAVISNIVSLHSKRKAKDTLSKYYDLLNQQYMDEAEKEFSFQKRIVSNNKNDYPYYKKYNKLLTKSILQNNKKPIKDFEIEDFRNFKDEYVKTLEEIARKDLIVELTSNDIKTEELYEINYLNNIEEKRSRDLNLVSKKAEIKKQASVIGLLLKSKQKEILQASIALSFITVLFNILGYRFDEPILVGNAFICLCFVLLITYQLLLNYRIKNGLYGTNNYEAREIIEFILNNSDEFKSGSGKTISIFPEEESIDIIFDTNSILVRGYTNG